ncbi:MAG: thiamine phosphate synthase [Candidatus Acidiferrales bacterium]
MPPVPDTPIVCYVTDRRSLGAGRAVAGVRGSIEAAIEAGVDWLQIREKDLPARELLALVQGTLQAAANLTQVEENRGGEGAIAGSTTQVIVNDRLDVALAAGAAGAHLGRESLRVQEVADWCGRGNAPPDLLIGVSCHTLEEAREAEVSGASYIFFGPIFDTPSKRSFGTPQGIERLAEVSASLRIPVIAIGGVDEDNARRCLSAGAAGIAAIRMFQKALNPQTLKTIVDRIHRHIP